MLRLKASQIVNDWLKSYNAPLACNNKNEDLDVSMSQKFGKPDFCAYIQRNVVGPPTCELPTSDHKLSSQSPYKERPAGRFLFRL